LDAITAKATALIMKTPQRLYDSRAARKAAEKAQIEREKELSNGRLFLAANEKLGALFRRAKQGDSNAGRMFLGCLIDNIEQFKKFCVAKRKVAKLMVVLDEPWPLLHTDLKVRKGYLTLPADHSLRKLGIVRKGRSYNEETTETRVALTLYRQMEFYRKLLPLTVWSKDEAKMHECYNVIRRLKRLSPRNYKKWWKAAEPLFDEQWGKQFQDHSDFCDWNAKAYKDLKPHVTRSAKRRDIKKAIKQAFKSLANALRDRVLD
jgi:hypothetical protein